MGPWFQCFFLKQHTISNNKISLTAMRNTVGCKLAFRHNHALISTQCDSSRHGAEIMCAGKRQLKRFRLQLRKNCCFSWDKLHPEVVIPVRCLSLKNTSKCFHMYQSKWHSFHYLSKKKAQITVFPAGHPVKRPCFSIRSYLCSMLTISGCECKKLTALKQKAKPVTFLSQIT